MLILFKYVLKIMIPTLVKNSVIRNKNSFALTVVGQKA